MNGKILREFGINMYIPLYLKWITNKDLLYSTGNPAQCYVAAWMGGKFRGKWIHAYVPLSPLAVHLKSSQRVNQSVLCYAQRFSRVQLFVTPMNCNLPGSSVHGILQARILEWLTFPSPGDRPNPGTDLGSPALQAESFLSDPPGEVQHSLLYRGRRRDEVSLCCIYCENENHFQQQAVDNPENVDIAWKGYTGVTKGPRGGCRGTSITSVQNSVSLERKRRGFGRTNGGEIGRKQLWFGLCCHVQTVMEGVSLASVSRRGMCAHPHHCCQSGGWVSG